MADIDSTNPHKGLQAGLQNEPLRSALKVQLPPLKPNDPTRAVPALLAVGSIDRLLDCHRLKAALRADAELTLITRKVEQHPGNPGIAERFIGVLGAWASTRRALGLIQDARLAAGRALAWTLEDPCSSTYAFAVQRAVGILPGADDITRTEHALAVHLATPGAADAVAECLVELADLYAARAAGRQARCYLEAALGLTVRALPWQRFRIQSRLVHRLLTDGTVDDAEALLDSVDPSAFPLPSKHAWLRARSAVAEAREQKRSPLRFQLDALELATETCGTEILLDDVLNVGHLRARFPGTLDAEDEGRLMEAARRLCQIATDDDPWVASIRRLTRRLIIGKPMDDGEPGNIRDRLLRLHQRYLAEEITPSLDPCEQPACHAV